MQADLIVLLEKSKTFGMQLPEKAIVISDTKLSKFVGASWASPFVQIQDRIVTNHVHISNANATRTTMKKDFTC